MVNLLLGAPHPQLMINCRAINLWRSLSMVSSPQTDVPTIAEALYYFITRYKKILSYLRLLVLVSISMAIGVAVSLLFLYFCFCLLALYLPYVGTLPKPLIMRGFSILKEMRKEYRSKVV